MAKVRDGSGIYESTEGVSSDPKQAPTEAAIEQTDAIIEAIIEVAAVIDRTAGETEEGNATEGGRETSDEARKESVTEIGKKTALEEEGNKDEKEEDEENEEEEEEDKENDEGGREDEEEEKEKDEEDEEEEKEQDEEEDEEKENDEEENQEEREKDEEEKEDGNEQNHQDTDDDDDDQPVQPEKMFFGPREYNKACKIGTRCSVRQTVEYLEKHCREEVKWFRNHYQFQHIFHMPKEPNHMSQGLWMLLLCTAYTESEKECWFVVNGVPIRYSIKEQALLTILDCDEYPNNYEKLGDLKFVESVFGRSKEIKVKDVEHKMEEMIENNSTDCTNGKKKKKRSKKSTTMNETDRQKMIVLYFLCKIVIAKSKSDRNIDEFFLRVVDDLQACEDFPWGRFTFDTSMNEIRRVMKNLSGVVKPNQQIAFSGFIVPLEIMAFECIPQLGRKFREGVPAEKDCPRMCKHMFSESALRGHTLEDITRELGSTKEIWSILEPDADEKHLLSRIIDDGVDGGIGFIDPVVDSWRERLIVQRKKICWKDLYELDLGSRHDHPDKVAQVPANVVASIVDLKEVMDNRFDEIIAKIGAMDNKISLIDGRVRELEVSQISRNLGEDHVVQYGTEMNLNDGGSQANMEEIAKDAEEEKEKTTEEEKNEEENREEDLSLVVFDENMDEIADEDKENEKNAEEESKEEGNT